MKKLNIYYFILKLLFIALGLQIELCIRGVSSWAKIVMPASNCIIVLILDKLEKDLKNVNNELKDMSKYMYP